MCIRDSPTRSYDPLWRGFFPWKTKKKRLALRVRSPHYFTTLLAKIVRRHANVKSCLSVYRPSGLSKQIRLSRHVSPTALCIKPHLRVETPIFIFFRADGLLASHCPHAYAAIYSCGPVIWRRTVVTFLHVWAKCVGQRGQFLASYTMEPHAIFEVVICIHSPCPTRSGLNVGWFHIEIEGVSSAGI